MMRALHFFLRDTRMLSVSCTLAKEFPLGALCQGLRFFAKGLRFATTRRFFVFFIAAISAMCFWCIRSMCEPSVAQVWAPWVHTKPGVCCHNRWYGVVKRVFPFCTNVCIAAWWRPPFFFVVVFNFWMYRFKEAVAPLRFPCLPLSLWQAECTVRFCNQPLVARWLQQPFTVLFY